MKDLLAGIVFLFLLSGCEPVMNDNFQTFLISKGNHYAEGRHLESLQTDRLLFEAKFDESAIYTFDEAGFQDSKNKLLGFAECNTQHHENSARFAWQWYHGQIEIYAYCYRDGARVEQYLGTTYPGEINQYEIVLTPNTYNFRLKNVNVTIERGSVCNFGAYQMLWPYFGGQLPAPHDVRIDIRRF
jgi:hypothetical protein